MGSSGIYNHGDQWPNSRLSTATHHQNFAFEHACEAIQSSDPVFRELERERNAPLLVFFTTVAALWSPNLGQFAGASPLLRRNLETCVFVCSGMRYCSRGISTPLSHVPWYGHKTSYSLLFFWSKSQNKLMGSYFIDVKEIQI